MLRRKFLLLMHSVDATKKIAQTVVRFYHKMSNRSNKDEGDCIYAMIFRLPLKMFKKVLNS